MSATLPVLRLRILLVAGLIAVTSLSVRQVASAQASAPNEWTWMGGSGPSNSYGVFGTLGTPAAGNIPASRQFAARWTDKNGNFWLFGGGGAYAPNDLWEFYPSTNEWAWMGGSSTMICVFGAGCGDPGVFGTLGTPAAGNIPGSRYGAVSWTDSSGKFWLFGGVGNDGDGQGGFRNDLWNFDPSTNEWTWMGGPSACGSGCQQPGVYGTLGTFATGNFPENNEYAMGWTDKNGNLWLFGGFGTDEGEAGAYSQGDLNLLWEFNPSTNEWAYMGGNTVGNGYNSPGVYGTLGTPDAGNIPPGRQSATTWTDSKGNLWLFGGGFGPVDYVSTTALNDLWEFNPSTNQWAWMSGSSTVSSCWTYGTTYYGQYTFCSQPGVYGTLGVPAAGNIPGGRSRATGWADSSGNFWLFGGFGYDANGPGLFNDLWEFNPSTSEWTWMGGNSTVGSCTNQRCGQPSEYGTLGMPAVGNAPGGRSDAVGWTDNSGNFWLFGGFYGADELWEYQPSTASLPAAVMPAFSVAAGTYTTAQTVTISDAMSGATIYYTTNGTTPTTSSSVYSVPITVSSSETIEAIATVSGYPTSGVATAAYTIAPLASAPTFSPSGGTYTAAQMVTISDTTPGAIIYYTTDGKLPIVGSSVYSVPIIVSSSETLQAMVTANGYSQSALATAAYTINLSQAATPTISLAAGTYYMPQTVTISDITPGAIIYYTTNGTQPTTSSTVYSGPVSVSSSETLEAIATASGYTQSALATAGYLITPLAVGGRFDWTWMGGSSTVPITSDGNGGQPGVYGTLGTPADGNVPGGRFTATSWTDSGGNLWLFGGTGFDGSGSWGTLNDLWEFNPVTNQWAWMGGSSVYGQPGVYGTLGTPAVGNNPGSRQGSASWTDSSGNLWLFGGTSCCASGFLNDLWEFNPSTNQWAWMGGGNGSTMQCANNGYGLTICAQPGVYGTLGVPAAGNIPRGRQWATSWNDSSGNFWLYGGWGMAANGNWSALNDLWKFNPSTNQWAWMSGSSSDAGNCTIPDIQAPNGSLCGPSGVYGTLGTPAAGNTPGGRDGITSWNDASGHLWLFGGSGFDANGNFGYLNDLWEFNPSTNLWSWMGGSSTEGINGVPEGQPGVYGTLGVPAAGNYPGARTFSLGWADNSGNFWLFGGYGADVNGPGGYLNDLWEFNPSTNQWVWMGGSISWGNNCIQANGDTLCGPAGVFGTLGVPAAGNIPGGRDYCTASWTDKNGNFWLFGGWNYDANGNLGYLNDLWKYQPAITLPATATPTFSVTSGTYAATQTVTISDTTANATIYYTTDGSTPTTSSNVYSAPIIVSSSETIEATAAASGYSQSAVATTAYTINLPQAATPSFSVAAGTYTATQTVTISDTTPGATIYYTLDGSTPTAGSTVYSGAITVSSTETIEAMATAIGYSQSAVATAAYTINLPAAATPTFSMAPGSYTAAQTVILSDGTAAATIYYTTDGTTPTAGSAVYSGPITVSSTETLQAMATAIGYSQSAVATAAYTINLPAAATPTFSMAPGSYTAAQTVILSDGTAAATIYYTTDGTTPTAGSAVYSGPITVSSTETLEAMASASGYLNSAMATAAYTINISTNPAPFIGSITPAYVSAGVAAFTLTVNGLQFIQSSTVYWGTTALATTYVSATQLTAQVPDADIASDNVAIAITVQTPIPGGGTSDALTFQVDSAASTATPPAFASTTAIVATGSPASYPVTLPSSVTTTTASCLNLPTGATCSYSATTNTVTITTSATTPAGTYQVTVVFNETVSGAATSWILLPILLFPLMIMRKRLAARGAWVTACLGLVLLAGTALCASCGGGGVGNSGGGSGGGGGGGGGSQTHQVTSSSVVSITVQ